MIPSLTPEAKQLLSATVRGLRERLLRDIRAEAERRYQLAVPLNQTGLDEAHRKKRERLEGWIEERLRAAKPKSENEKKTSRERLLQEAVKEAGATLLNRVVLVRHLEATGLSKPSVVTGGWSSKGYREFRDFAPALLGDETEGYAALLQLVFDDLAVDLPGLFGNVGLTKLFPVPPATLREVVTQLDAKELASAWTDDTTLGWVYQYWNDPERESLDAKIHAGGKIKPHEIASKTQMFTERYMVEWLLQNSLGLTWLCICKKNGWAPDADRVLPLLDARRGEWRKKREAGEVAVDTLMPIEGELEDSWKYYVPQPIPDDAVAKAPASIRYLKLLDPACGSGHFLVIAFGLLARMYREEARHCGIAVTDEQIAEAILENNLYGVDIDPRAIQIAAACLYMKAKSLTPNARPRRVNLVAPTLQLGNLPDDDPSLVQLRCELKKEAGISEDLTRRLVSALAGVDHLGTLLKVDAAVEEALQSAELESEHGLSGQGDLYDGFVMPQVKLSLGEVKATVLGKLEQFLTRHSGSEDLGLRLDGEQLAAGVRFVRTAKPDTYDVVVGNPPYQGLSKTDSFRYVATTYPNGRSDLYAAFLERAMQLVRPAGIAGLVTMRGWMFIGQFRNLRAWLLDEIRLCKLADLGTGAFSSRSMDDIISTGLVVCQRGPADNCACAIQAAPLADPRRDAGKPARRHAALLVQETRHDFNPLGFRAIDGEPIVYWWTKELLDLYHRYPLVGSISPAWAAQSTGDNIRFTRCSWEIEARRSMELISSDAGDPTERWHPLVAGADGAEWLEPLRLVVNWRRQGLEIKQYKSRQTGRDAFVLASEFLFFRKGVTFSKIGARFSGRAYRFASIFCDASSSLFPENVAQFVCLLNSRTGRGILESLNPTVNFQTGDVNRLPAYPIPEADTIFSRLEQHFADHETHRELSLEYRRPGSSQWRYAQTWAQHAVDRPSGAPLSPYEPEYDQPSSECFISFGIGIALGRFGANGEGILRDAPKSSLPAGILFLAPDARDSLEQPACLNLHEAWQQHGAAVGAGSDLRTYLRKSFFDYHKKLYENRPIYFPISSAKRSYVAFISIHRWKDDTLSVLLADHLLPERRRLEGELEDIRKARTQTTGKGKAEKRFAEVQKLLEELGDLIHKATQIAERGPPPPDDNTPSREADARYVMDLDDGVMVNSAALWPLLEPQWREPKKWWKNLATADGNKPLDWAHLAARYFPARVRARCEDDPSLAVAHGCFWELHPAKAYAWELYLQAMIKPEFSIDEPGANDARSRFLKEHATEAAEIRANETKRLERNAAKAEPEEENHAGALFDHDQQQTEAADA